jgi:hypothetical protein
MSRTGFARRGPLRAVVARLETHDVLDCGHTFTPARPTWKREHATKRHRCPLCPEAKRAAYWRGRYDLRRKPEPAGAAA